MWTKLVAYIRTRSREEWQAEARRFLNDARIWTQSNGEWSAGIAFLTGIAIVLEFRLFLAILLLLAIAAFAVWQIALPAQATSSDQPSKE
ncbi:MAG: hypothetical protein J0M12_07975 [Deltaproteobacteria bacterium]|nr:hypothetical protein [Deltaproteobacteria bacterium]